MNFKILKVYRVPSPVSKNFMEQSSRASREHAEPFCKAETERNTNWTLNSLQKRIDDDDVVEVKKERATKKDKREKQTEEEKELRKEKKLIKKRVSFLIGWRWIEANCCLYLGSRWANNCCGKTPQGRRQNNQNFSSQRRGRWAYSATRENEWCKLIQMLHNFNFHLKNHLSQDVYVREERHEKAHYQKSRAGRGSYN